MKRYFQAHYLLVFGGLALGLFLGVVVVDVEPAIFGWLFGAGIGITGGAYIAAIATNEQLVGGPAPTQAEWDAAIDDIFDEQGRLREGMTTQELDRRN